VRQVKRLLLALVLVSPSAGCGSGNKVNPKELTPEQAAEQAAALKEVSATEAERQKKSPRPEKSRTTEEEAAESERSRRR
jgi:hypothetical protein